LRIKFFVLLVKYNAENDPSLIDDSIFMKKWVISFFLLCSLSACSIIYRPHIQQGNILRQSTIEQLKLGMTEEQVRYLLGSCVLQSPFQANRNDYVYFYQPGHGQSIERHVTLIFSNGRLVSIKKVP
jgi:outer membrane protein assembly factor BamE